MKDLSIIICSHNGQLSTEFQRNLEDTVGCSFEIILINNSRNQHSIFEAYNIGIQKSTAPFIAFLHDDIFFHSQDWGKKLIEIFKTDPNLGLLGVAGSRIRSKVPAAWWENAEYHLVINIKQYDGRSGGSKLQYNGFRKNLEEVKTIDGVFMGLRKIEGVRFDETVPGFHNYDFNLCMEVLKRNFSIGVTREILIEHFSKGRIDASWVRSAHQVNKKYRHLLPVQVLQSEISKSDLQFNYFKFIENCRYTGCRKIGFKYWLRYLVLFPRSEQNKEWLEFFRKDII